jgi:hypothetical protein
VFGEDGFDEEQGGCFGHRFAATGEDLVGGSVVPIVDDAGEEIGVAAGWDGGEEVAVDAFGAAGETGGGEARGRLFDGARAVEEDTVEGRGCEEDRFEENTGTATDVDEATERSERVGGDDGGGFLAGAVGHGTLEGGSEGRIAIEVGKEGFAVDQIEWGAADADGVEETGSGLVVEVASSEDGAAKGTVDTITKTGAKVSQTEEAVRVFGEDALGGQTAEKSMECVRIGTDRAGDGVAGEGAVCKEIGDTEFGGDVEQLGNEVTVDQTGHLRLGGGIVRHLGPPCGRRGSGGRGRLVF